MNENKEIYYLQVPFTSKEEMHLFLQKRIKILLHELEDYDEIHLVNEQNLSSLGDTATALAATIDTLQKVMNLEESDK